MLTRVYPNTSRNAGKVLAERGWQTTGVEAELSQGTDTKVGIRGHAACVSWVLNKPGLSVSGEGASSVRTFVKIFFKNIPVLGR